MRQISLPVATAGVPLQSIDSALFAARGVRLSVLRLDAIHPAISGNKWFKLMPALQRAQQQGLPILSFGGAWSNHLHALAFAGHRLGIATGALVRGEPAYAANAMLSDARRWGMRLHFVSRAEYRDRHDAAYLQQLQQRFGPCVLVPEGGTDLAAIRAVQQIWQLPALVAADCDYLVTAVGTGGTLAGLVAGAPPAVQVVGVPVLRHGPSLAQDLRRWLDVLGAGQRSWHWLDDAHLGGYAKLTAELARLLAEVEGRLGVPLDPVYTGKALLALLRWLLRGGIAPGSHVILLHTGGLQGRRGMAEALARKAPAFVGPLAL